MKIRQLKTVAKPLMGLSMLLFSTAILAGCGSSSNTQAQQSSAVVSTGSSVDFSTVYNSALSDMPSKGDKVSSTEKSKQTDKSKSTSKTKAKATSSSHKSKNVVESHKTKNSASSDYQTSSGKKLSAAQQKLVKSIQTPASKVLNYQMQHNIGTGKKPDSSNERALAYANNQYAEQGHNNDNNVGESFLKQLYRSMTASDGQTDIFTKSAAKYAVEHISKEAKELNQLYHKVDKY